MVNVEVIGDQFYVHLDQYCDPAELMKKMNKACLIVEREAKRKCPVDTGMLRRSISSRVYTDGGSVVGEVYSDLDYAIYVEYGTGLEAEGGNGRKTPWRYQDDEGE